MAEGDTKEKGERVTLPELQVTCRACGANGRKCKTCNRTGMAPTAAGKAILDLVDNHFSAMLRREMNGGW